MPFAYRGYTDIAKPLLRGDGRSGCVSWSVANNKHFYSDEGALGEPIVQAVPPANA